MGNKICLIYNFAQHYRTNIFTLMDKEMPIDFVFGNSYLDVKKMDYSLLKGFKKEVKNIVFFKKPLYYQQGVVSLIFKNYKGYLILGESICVSTWILLLLAKVFRKKTYLWTHGWYGRESKIRTFMKKIFFSLADQVFLYGDYAKKLMISQGVKEEKLHVIYNSLDYDMHLKLRQKLQPSKIYSEHFLNTHPNLIFVGRLTYSKRIDLLLNSISELKSKGFFVNVTLVGNGLDKERLEQLCSNLNINDNVWFYGACYNEYELSELIYNADLCVSPGNVGLTAIHAMSYGTPVVTHENFPFQGPEFEAIQQGISGDFFEFNNAESLSKTILHWFSDSKDRNVTRNHCYKIIDEKYNPYYQLKIFNNVILN